MAHPEFTDHDMTLLLLVCRAYDTGIIICGLIAIITGHLAGGAGVTIVGVAAFAYTLVAGMRHATDRASTAQEQPCTQR